jgi:Ala-tRNA(Pro) deacylase
MAIPKKLQNYLDKNKIKHEILKHKKVFTVYDKAQTLGRKLGEIAKTLAVKADKIYALVVVPASHRVDLGKLKKILKVKKLEIAKEQALNKIFKMKPGTHVPFGTFHKIPVYIDKALLKNKLVIVSGGSYTESLKMKAKDLLNAGAQALTSFSKKIK